MIEIWPRSGFIGCLESRGLVLHLATLPLGEETTQHQICNALGILVDTEKCG